MKKTYFNSDEDIYWPPQCHNIGSTAGAGGFTAGAAAPAVNMLEEALHKHILFFARRHTKHLFILIIRRNISYYMKATASDLIFRYRNTPEDYTQHSFSLLPRCSLLVLPPGTTSTLESRGRESRHLPSGTDPVPMSTVGPTFSRGVATAHDLCPTLPPPLCLIPCLEISRSVSLCLALSHLVSQWTGHDSEITTPSRFGDVRVARAATVALFPHE